MLFRSRVSKYNFEALPLFDARQCGLDADFQRIRTGVFAMRFGIIRSPVDSNRIYLYPFATFSEHRARRWGVRFPDHEMVQRNSPGLQSRIADYEEVPWLSAVVLGELDGEEKWHRSGFHLFTSVSMAHVFGRTASRPCSTISSARGRTQNAKTRNTATATVSRPAKYLLLI